jgi:predicted extracellular nuclease
MRIHSTFIAVVFLLFADTAFLVAQVSFTAGAGMTQTQNFDGLGTASGAVASPLPANWKMAGNGAAGDFASAGTTTTQARGTFGATILGGASAGGLYNFANGVTASATDRAPGFLSSGGFTSPHYLFVQTQNNSGAFITSVNVAYTIEKYRSGSRAFTIDFWTSTDGTTWTQHAAGTDAFPADANNTTISNPPTNTTKNFTITGLAIANGGNLFLRWSYTGTGGSTNGQGLGIDDVTLVAVNGVPAANAAYSSSDFPEDVANNGTITATRTITLTNAQWLNSITNGNPLTPTTHYTTANVPPGMALTVTKNSNTQVTVALTGTATNHAVANNITNLTLTFQDAVIEGGVPAASTITGLNRNNLTVTFLNPAPPPSRIRAIQGTTHISPLVGANVTNVPGIVTAVRDNGFFMQDPTDDGDNRTSEGIFIFTSAAPPGTIAVGDSVHVSGRVIEFRTSNPDGLTLTEIGNPGLTIVEQVAPSMTITPTLIGSGGRPIPTNIISNDAVGGDADNIATNFDPSEDGLDFYESLENMLIRVNNAIIVSNENSPMAFVADNGANATGRTPQGGVAISGNDDNPERLYLIRNDNSLATPGNRKPGDSYPGAIIGVIEYSSDVYRLRYTQALPTVVPSTFTPEVTALTGDANRLTVASYNAYNMNPSSAHITAFGAHIVNNLRSPDIIGLQEIQDNNGATNNGVVDADMTLNAIIAAIQAAGGPTYQFRQINPVNNADGGAGGANIRVAVLFNPGRVQFVDRGTPSSVISTAAVNSGSDLQLSISPGRIDAGNTAWSSTRKPLASEFMFNGRKVFVIVAHLSSKIGDGPSFGHLQPPVLGSEAKRVSQGASINAFVNSMLAVDPLANVVIVGDMNEHEFRPPMTTMAGSIMYNLLQDIPINDRYTYNFEGNSQVLDNILVVNRLRNFFQSSLDIVHLNADRNAVDWVSDHDPVLARVDFTTPATSPVSGSVSNSSTTQGPRIASFAPQYGLSGTIVTILGQGFSGATNVSFGGVAARSFQVLSDGLIYATVGNGATGAVSVTSTFGTLSLNGFIYGTPPPEPPVVTNISPATVVAGDTIFISGERLSSIQGVFLDGERVPFYETNGNSLVVIARTSQSGSSVNVQLGWSGSRLSVGNITITPLSSPIITRISPRTFTSTDATVGITIEGTNLGRIWGYTVTKAGGSEDQISSRPISITASSVTFAILPQNQNAGTHVIKLFNANGQVISTTLGILAAPAPRFGSLEYTTTANGQVGKLWLGGTGFFRTATIRINGVPMTSRVESSTSLTIDLPASMTVFQQSYRVEALNSDGQSTEATLHVRFSFRPEMKTVSVRRRSNEFLLTISGSHFQAGLLLGLNSTPLRVLSVNDSTIIASINAPLPMTPQESVRPMVLHLTNPNDSKHGLWISHALFSDAMATSFSAVAQTNILGEATNEEIASLQQPKTHWGLASETKTSAETTSKKFSIFPNPAYDILLLQGLDFGKENGAVLRIVSSYGAVIAEYAVVSSEMQLPIQSLAPGLYWVEVHQPTLNVRQRLTFLKQ